jgi:ABC-type transport system involved in multi-copper enzyme maturation permease subunit
VSATSLRLRAIVSTDLRLRWRRTSTIVTLLLMIVIAYGVVPDFHTGSTVMAIEGHRAVYNSAALSIATAMFASFFLGLFGFYLVSNALQRDLETRTGYVIAATPIRNAEYLAGKFAGNLLFLATLLAVYLAGVLLMHLLRGEAPIEPWTYFSTYALLAVPVLVFVSVFGLLFECLTPLSGRGGDILYFFIWVAVLSIGAIGADTGSFNWKASAFDVMGLGYLLGEMHRQGLPANMAVGHTVFDPGLDAVAIQPLAVGAGAVVARLVAVLLPLPLLLLALASFHRFDPARVRSAARQGGRGLLAQLSRLLKPLTRLLLPIAAGGGRTRWRFAGQIVADATVTLMLSPVTLVALLGVTAASVITPLERLRSGVLPAISLLLILALAEVATRDKSVGAGPMLDGMPRLRARRVAWKLGSAALVALVFALVPMLRLALAAPGSAVALLVGTLFTATLAVALGTMTGTPKTFAALFLFFLYLVLNGGSLPALDFAGWTGLATPAVTLGYLIATLVIASAAIAWQQLTRY